MNRFMLKSRIQGATVTDVNVDSDGSLTVDEILMRAADLLPFEQVRVDNLASGESFETCVLKGKRDSGTVSVNGAAASLVSPGDPLSISSYVLMEEKKTDLHMPTLVRVGEDNRIKAG